MSTCDTFDSFDSVHWYLMFRAPEWTNKNDKAERNSGKRKKKCFHFN